MLCRFLAKKVDGLLTLVYITLAMMKGGDDPMSLAEKVKQRREKLGMNQKQLADTSGITQATISRIESGQVKELKSEALKRLAAALRVTVDFLVDRTDSLTPKEVVESDPNADYIFRGYEKLSAKGREQVKHFVHFLEQQEAEEERRRR
jgi:transcriptional regulator with XRE-family HTH domain